jgi:hypothetical protein
VQCKNLLVNLLVWGVAYPLKKWIHLAVHFIDGDYTLE